MQIYWSILTIPRPSTFYIQLLLPGLLQKPPHVEHITIVQQGSDHEQGFPMRMITNDGSDGNVQKPS